MGWMCVTAGDFAGTPPVFKAMPDLAVIIPLKADSSRNRRIIGGFNDSRKRN